MTSQGSTNLSDLIRSMSPSLDQKTYVFAHVPAEPGADASHVFKLLAGMPIQMMFREAEGWTVIATKDLAETMQMEHVFPCKRITLNVHSSLAAVGFMAAITTKLASLSIGVNPVSGFYHDHLFVPEGTETTVMEALEQMSSRES